MAAVLVGVVLSRLFGMMDRVGEVAVCDVRVVAALYMIAGFVMFRGFAVMFRRVLMVLGCLMMVRSAFVISHMVYRSP
jgi:hypothetical protein